MAKVPFGYFDANASGRLRRIIDGCRADRDVIAHKMPDCIASITAPVAIWWPCFLDWVMGLVCLIPVAVSCSHVVDDGARRARRPLHAALPGGLEPHVHGGHEYVRVPVVKVFQQTVHSFRAFAAIVDYRDMATNYVTSAACRWCSSQPSTAPSWYSCRRPSFGGRGGRLRPLSHRPLFYVIFSAFTTTVMSKVMYSSRRS
ncbi:MAG: hypothetical protein ACLUW6_04885 [Coriobacteriaceae bacterium]